MRTSPTPEGFKVSPYVSNISKILVVAFILFCAIQAENAGEIFSSLSGMLLQNFKWILLLSVTGICFFLLYLMLSRYGLIKLGKDDEKPEYSFFSWASMLFSCGMGVGLIFWSVAEPMWHYMNNPFAPALSDASATTAIQLTFFHWGLHAWSIYCIVALAVGYFSFRKDLPFALRTTLYPLIGNRVFGAIGHSIGIMVIVVTTFGISQTLALGVLQINSGLNQVFGITIGLTMQFIILFSLSMIATISVVGGIGKGMRRLSELNIILSVLLVLIILSVGPARYITHTYLEGIGNYAQNFIGMSLWSDTQKDSGWQNYWTAFYWAWWMTWAPFVGMFIAKISRGRTIRQLIAGVLILPTLVTFFWMSVFGGSALKIEQETRHIYEQKVQAIEKKAQITPIKPTPENPETINLAPSNQMAQANTEFVGGEIVKATQQDNTLAIFTLFKMLDGGLLGTILSIVCLTVLVTYLVTSQDSGTHVLCFLDTLSPKDTPIKLRLVWSFFITLISAGLLYAGGLKAIQSAVILFGFPISILLVLMCIALMKSLHQELRIECKKTEK